MSAEGIRVNFRHFENGQMTDDSSNITLPNPSLQRMGDTINGLYGTNGLDWPGTPSIPGDRHSLTLFGGYINTVHL